MFHPLPTLGRELLHLQGIQLPYNCVDKLTETQMTDLAGNAFHETSFRLCFHFFGGGDGFGLGPGGDDGPIWLTLFLCLRFYYL